MRSIAVMTIAALPALLAAQHRDDRDWRYKDQESIKRNFDVSASSSPQKLLVDNISGYVHVNGYSGREIQVSVQKHIGADSNEARSSRGAGREWRVVRDRGATGAAQQL